MQFKTIHFPRRSRAVIALVLSGLVLLLNAMAASPALHELIHADAGKADHQCAITLFSHGQVDSAAADVPLMAALALAGDAPKFAISLFCPAVENLSLGRAPPVASVIS